MLNANDPKVENFELLYIFIVFDVLYAIKQLCLVLFNLFNKQLFLQKRYVDVNV